MSENYNQIIKRKGKEAKERLNKMNEIKIIKSLLKENYTDNQIIDYLYNENIDRNDNKEVLEIINKVKKYNTY